MAVVFIGAAGLVGQAAAQHAHSSPANYPSSVPVLHNHDHSYDLPRRDDRARRSDERGMSPHPYTGHSGDGIRPPTEVGATSASANAARLADYETQKGTARELPPHLRRQIVEYGTQEPSGTIIIDTAKTYLYLVLGNDKAIRYGIGVGREGFTWSGRERISRMAEWPDWHPPAEMIERQPYLPRFMAGGLSNPLGARALYLGKTIFRIHGTNEPSTIGGFVSSGCIRMLNEDVENLYRRVNVGSQVVVLPGNAPVPALR